MLDGANLKLGVEGSYELFDDRLRSSDQEVVNNFIEQQDERFVLLHEEWLC